MWWLKTLTIFSFLILYTNGQIAYKICALKKDRETYCSQLTRGTSEVSCQIVQDGIECAQRIMNGTADFGYFPAENILHLAAMHWDRVTVINEVKHTERDTETVDFESVVIVHKDHQNGLEGLRGKKYCHPGLNYGNTQRWTERFLKYFEREVVPINCQISKSPPEIEINALDTYFEGGCRPGKWSHDRKEDTRLKQKYSRMCSLCDSDTPCEYSAHETSNYHQQALGCLKRGGQVVYVAKYEAAKFFRRNSDLTEEYRYLCKNGTTEPISNNHKPCVWLRQPWGAILAASEKAVSMSKTLDSWINRPGSGTWQSALKELMGGSSYKITQTTMQSPVDHMKPFLDFKIPYEKSLCETDVSWCTTSEDEKQKCDVVSAGAITSGVYPIIKCPSPRASVVQCMDDINKELVDFMGIDSNYGFLARGLYNLTAALYFETEADQYSSIVVAVRDGSKFNSFNSLKGAKACLPEFGSTASMAFINLGKENGFFARNECRYGKLLHNFFGPSCAPGASDLKHERKINQEESLCALCTDKIATTMIPALLHTRKDGPVVMDNPVQLTGDSCSAQESNRYFGNQGALRCLTEAGEVAILELQSLKQHALELNLDENQYRIICRNGSLASMPGFDVDSKCALTTIVDGEIVIRRKSEKSAGIVNVLTALDLYFQNEPDFKMYNIFAGHKHLLFKDSTNGLIASDEDKFSSTVTNYVKLFENLEKCVQGGSANILPINFFIMISISLFLTMRYF